jgi:hypothetical protein
MVGAAGRDQLKAIGGEEQESRPLLHAEPGDVGVVLVEGG